MSVNWQKEEQLCEPSEKPNYHGIRAHNIKKPSIRNPRELLFIRHYHGQAKLRSTFEYSLFDAKACFALQKGVPNLFTEGSLIFAVCIKSFKYAYYKQ